MSKVKNINDILIEEIEDCLKDELLNRAKQGPMFLKEYTITSRFKFLIGFIEHLKRNKINSHLSINLTKDSKTKDFNKEEKVYTIFNNLKDEIDSKYLKQQFNNSLIGMREEFVKGIKNDY